MTATFARRVILESPFAGDVAANITYARACVRDSLSRGEAPIASHLLYPACFAALEATVSVPLTRGFEALIDQGDAERVLAHKWFAQGDEPHIYAARHQRIDGAQLTIYMHRFIVEPDDDKEVDHRNGAKLDNRRSNLRSVTHQENSQNTKKRADNTSGYKGVSRQGQKWRAYVRAEGDQVYLGAFATAEEAARVYDAESVRRYGRFARLNFPTGGALNDEIPAERQWGIDAGLSWGGVADATVVYIDFGISKGMEYGIENAKRLNRPIEYRQILRAPEDPRMKIKISDLDYGNAKETGGPAGAMGAMFDEIGSGGA